MKISDKVLVVCVIMCSLGIVFLIFYLQNHTYLLWSILCITVSAIGIVAVIIIRWRGRKRRAQPQFLFSQSNSESAETTNDRSTEERQKTTPSLPSIEVIKLVFHGRFGVGDVVESDGKYMKVRFSDAVKTFVYPDSFQDGYLKIYYLGEGSDPKVDPKPALEATSVPEMQTEQMAVRQNVLYRNAYKGYGNRAQAIYIKFCEEYGWDVSKSGCFAPQKQLFAEKATKEGYDVWFIANSNWTQTKGGVWRNMISSDFETIEESWDAARAGLYDLEHRRVVFAKVKGNGYIFLGIYQAVRVEKYQSMNGCTWKKFYRTVSTKYPQESGE